MLKVSSHTSRPQPEPPENPALTVNDATTPAMLTANGA
jgi:hypothetical protein